MRLLPGLLLFIFWPLALNAGTFGVSASQASPSAISQDFLNLRSSKVLSSGTYGFGAASDWVTNTLPYYPTGGVGNAKVSSSNDTIGRLHLAGAYGLSRRITLELALPVIVYQSVKDKKTVHGEFASYGVEALQGGFRASLMTRPHWGLALFAGMSRSLTSGFSKEAELPAQAANVEILGDYKLKSLRLTLNVGTIERMGSSESASRTTLGVGAGYALWAWRSEAILEVFGSTPRRKLVATSDRQGRSSEIIVGGRHYLSNRSSLQLGIGKELNHGVNTPDLRVLLGFNYSGTLPRWAPRY